MFKDEIFYLLINDEYCILKEDKEKYINSSETIFSFLEFQEKIEDIKLLDKEEFEELWQKDKINFVIGV